jgi:hypothetical protein
MVSEVTRLGSYQLTQMDGTEVRNSWNTKSTSRGNPGCAVGSQTPTPRTEAKVLKKSNDARMAQTISETGPSVSAEARSLEIAPIILEKEGASEKSKSPAPGAPAKELEFIVRHASGKLLSEEQIVEAQHYAKDLKYPRGSLVYGGDDEPLPSHADLESGAVGRDLTTTQRMGVALPRASWFPQFVDDGYTTTQVQLYMYIRVVRPGSFEFRAGPTCIYFRSCRASP